MAFTRKFLTDHGVPEDQIDAIMTERNRTLADYVPKSDLQSQIDAALEEARKDQPQALNVQESDEYKALAAKLARTEAIASDDFAGIKPKFRGTVYDMLDHEKPVAEQLPEIAKQFEEYFTPTTDPAPADPGKPQFSGPDKGGMPQGGTKKSLGDLWGFGK